MLDEYGGSIWLAVERKQTRSDVSKWPFSCQNISVVFLVLIVLQHDVNCFRSFDNNYFIIRLSFPVPGNRSHFAYHFKSGCFNARKKRGSVTFGGDSVSCKLAGQLKKVSIFASCFNFST